VAEHSILHFLNTAPMSAWVPEHDKRQPKASAKVTDAANTQPSSILKQELADLLEDDGNPEWVDDDPAGWDNLFIGVESDSND